MRNTQLCTLLVLITLSNASILDRILEFGQLTAEKIQKLNLSMHEAMYYKKLADGDMRCELCPFQCTIAKGKRGICGVRANVDGKLVALSYGKVAAAHVDPIEKKPLFHFFPSSLSYSIATAGCNLSCAFCQNWSLSQVFPEDARATDVTPAEIVAHAKENNCKSISYTYSEPTVFYEYMLDIAKLAKNAGIANVWVTCGFINEKPLRELCKYLDAANVDLKGTESFYTKLTKSSGLPVRRTLRILREEKVWIEITILLVTGENDNLDSIYTLCKWIVDSLGTDVPIHFSRFFPNYKMQNTPPTPYETLLQAQKLAISLGAKYVYIGNVPNTDFEDTFDPKTHEKIVDRNGYIILESKISASGKAPSGTIIPGIWR